MVASSARDELLFLDDTVTHQPLAASVVDEDETERRARTHHDAETSVLTQPRRMFIIGLRS